MPAVTDAPRIARQPRDPGTETTAKSGAASIDNTLAQWEKFLAKQPGCDSGFVAAPGQAMRAINVSSAAQVPMILRELHRGDESIRISFPPSTDPNVTEDQIKIRAFLQEHHGKELASLKSELTTLLEGSHSFKELQTNNKFNKAFGSAAKWIDANFKGVESNNSMLTVTDVVSLESATDKREDTIAAAIVSLQESHKSGRAAVVTVSHADAQDSSLKDAIRARLGEVSQIDPSKVKVWIGAEAGAITETRPGCEGVRELSFGEFLASTDAPLEANTSPKNDDVVSASAPTSGPTHQAPVDSLEDLHLGAAASKAVQEAALGDNHTPEATTAPAQATELKVGVAVDNHRRGYQQEDRHFVAPFPPIDPEQAMECLRRGVTAMDEVTKHNTAGSTFTGVIVTKDGDFVTAHLGDSPASAIIIGSDGTLKKIVSLTFDHKPGDGEGTSPSGVSFGDFDGYRRVSGAGGIAMTRALGDAHFGDTLSHEPEIRLHQIQSQLEAGDRLFLLTTSDGAHNEKKGITHSRHAQTLAEKLAQDISLLDISQQIAADSERIEDNVTVALLEIEKGKGAIVAVFDGHGGTETSEQAQGVLREIVERFEQSDQPTANERAAERATLEEKLKLLAKQLNDAVRLEGEFSSGADLVEADQLADKGLHLVERMRDLRERHKTESDEEKKATLYQEMQNLFGSYRMDKYGASGDSFERCVDRFEAYWREDSAKIQKKIEEYNQNTLEPAMARLNAEILDTKRAISALAGSDAITSSATEGETTTYSISAESQETMPELQRRESLETRLEGLRASLERAERLGGPWIERLSKFDTPIADASNTIQAAEKVIELHQRLYGEVSSNLPDSEKTKLERELLNIYEAHEMFRHRARREPGSNRESLVEAVRKFKSHSEGQLQAAQAAREEYIQHQVGTFKMLTTALIALTKRELGSHASASSDTFTDLSQEQVKELIEVVKNQELRKALTKYHDMLCAESAQSSGSSFDA